MSIKTARINTAEKIIIAAAVIFAYFFMSHPDLWETANHSYVFLESIFDGKVMDFYRYCARHENTYYYINRANYNIMVYVVFGLWELPVFLFNRIFSLSLNEAFLIYWAKAVSVMFFAGSGLMVKKICRRMGLSQTDALAAAMFFLFNPIAFYSPVAMGQYDSLCLFFALWALVWYLKKDMKKFSLIMGAGVVFKFFPFLIFIPLLLLAEKKILNIVKYGLFSLWLYIPTTLLYMGRTGNAAAFTGMMIERMFASSFHAGITSAPVFFTVYIIIVFACYLYKKDGPSFDYLAVYLPMVVFSLLFTCIYWHPQWLILLMPFVVITTFLQKGRTVWFYLDVAMSAGFFGLCYLAFPGRCASRLFGGGVLNHIFGLNIYETQITYVWQFLRLVPYCIQLIPAVFAACLIIGRLFKFPVKGVSLADRLSDGARYDKIPLKVFGYGIFAAGFGLCWLAPSALEWLNALSII